jgi:hypothetical protein
MRLTASRWVPIKNDMFLAVINYSTIRTSIRTYMRDDYSLNYYFHISLSELVCGGWICDLSCRGPCQREGFLHQKVRFPLCQNSSTATPPQRNATISPTPTQANHPSRKSQSWRRIPFALCKSKHLCVIFLCAPFSRRHHPN